MDEEKLNQMYPESYGLKAMDEDLTIINEDN